MPETSPALDPLRRSAFAHALDAGHAAAAAGQWSAAAARFSDALDALGAPAYDAPHDATTHAPAHAPTPDPHLAVALSNLGQALARVGRWADAERALRRAASARDALVHAGLAAPSVSARGWSDVAALLAAAGPEDDARDALAHARALLTDADDAAVLAALDETAALVGARVPPAIDEPTNAFVPSAAPGLDAGAFDDRVFDDRVFDDRVFDDRVFDAGAFDATPPDDPFEPLPSSTAPSADAFALDVALLEIEASTDASATAETGPVDESVDADWRPTPVFDAEPLESEGPDLDALLALAAGPPEPEPPTVELDAGDSMADALDAAIEWVPAPAGGAEAVVEEQPASIGAAAVIETPDDRALAPGSEPAPSDDEPEWIVVAPPVARASETAADPDADDDLDAEPELLTPGVDFADLRDLQDLEPAAARARGASGGAGRGQRLAAIDAIVEMTEERQSTRGGGLRGLLRRLTGR
jgi:tetratricopeptide (TPR) repeat protein